MPLMENLSNIIEIISILKALKQDIVRSITARCEIHCEDLLLIEEEQKGI